MKSLCLGNPTTFWLKKNKTAKLLMGTYVAVSVLVFSYSIILLFFRTSWSVSWVKRSEVSCEIRRILMDPMITWGFMGPFGKLLYIWRSATKHDTRLLLMNLEVFGFGHFCGGICRASLTNNLKKKRTQKSVGTFIFREHSQMENRTLRKERKWSQCCDFCLGGWHV